MSVINTMLKDLEERKEKTDDTSDVTLAGLSANSTTNPPKKIRGNPYFLIFSSMALLLLVASVAYFLSPYTLTKNSGSISNPIPDKDIALEKKGKTTSSDIDANDVDMLAEKEKAVMSASGQDIASSVHSEVNDIRPTVKTTNVVNKDKVVEKYSEDHIELEKHTNTSKGTETTSSSSLPDVLDKKQQTQQNNVTLVVNSKDTMVISGPRKSKYQLALESYNNHDTQYAKVLLWEILKESPENNEALKLLSLVHLYHGQLELAKETLSTALLRNPSNQELQRIHLKILIKDKDYNGAIQAIKNGNLISSPEDEAYLAGLYQKVDDHQNAIRLYTSALKSKPGNSIWWMGKGISLETLSMNNEALEAYYIARTLGNLTLSLKDYVNQRIYALENTHGVN